MASRRRHRHHKRKLYKRPGFYVLLISIAFCIFGVFWLFKFRILPTLFMTILVELDLIVLLLLWYLLIHRHRRWMKITGYIIAACLCISNGIMGYYISITQGAIEKMTEIHPESGDYVDLDVLADSAIQSVQDLEGRTIGVLRSMDAEQRDLMIQYLESQNISYTLKEYDSSLMMGRNLKGQAIDAIILYQPYLSIIESYEGMDGFSKNLRTLYQIPCKSQSLESAEKVDVTKDPFIILVSGIDTYGKMSASGRSDVNMLVAVNPSDRSILLLSIPRDYYVEVDCGQNKACPAGEKDKLTHTGIYGVESTEKSLEKLFGVPINYVVRINFSSVVNIIDALGGVDVNNVDTFKVGNYDFKPGMIHMDGDMALAFSRERYSFEEGDRERGRNQMRVVEGMIRKAISPKILESYTKVLDAAADSIQMNLSANDIAALVNMQLSTPASWAVYQYSISGSDAQKFAPALGDEAYVMIPDEKMVENARLDLQAMLHNEKPLYVSGG